MAKARNVKIFSVTSTTYWTRDDGLEFDFGQETENVAASDARDAIERSSKNSLVGQTIDADPDEPESLPGKVTRIEFSSVNYVCDATV